MRLCLGFALLGHLLLVLLMPEFQVEVDGCCESEGDGESDDENNDEYDLPAFEAGRGGAGDAWSGAEWRWWRGAGRLGG